MKRILEWKDARLGWKLLALCSLALIATPFIFEISKIEIWLIAAFLLLINSTALFRTQELDTQDFFLYFQPVSRARILASKTIWAILSTIAIIIMCVVSWHIINWQLLKTPLLRSETAFFPFGLLPILFLAALAPLVTVLYFRSSQITTIIISCIAVIVWGIVVLLLCPFVRLSLVGDVTGQSDITIGSAGWLEFVGMLIALVAWNFYLFCRTDITEKPIRRSALLGIEFIFVFGWLAYVIGGTNLWDLWYLLFG